MDNNARNQNAKTFASSVSCFVARNKSDAILEWQLVVCVNEKNNSITYNFGLGNNNDIDEIVRNIKNNKK